VPRPISRTEAGLATRPNVVLIVLDDLDARMVAQMPGLQTLVGDQGVTFSNFFVTSPLCGPSRASLLRGQYAHNHGMLANTGQEGGFQTFHRLGREESTVATWLQAAGYHTALVGKYLNGFPKGVDPRYIPPGWDEWFGFSGRHPSYYGFELNENGTLRRYGTSPADYNTDVLAARATDFVSRASDAGSPFFLVMAPLAPHDPAPPAPRHAEAFAEARAPRPPSHNEADVDDKPSWVRAVPVLTPGQLSKIDDLHRQRLRSLLAVDEMVVSLVDTLRQKQGLENTYFFFTSDNGSFAGEHRLGIGKQAAYEEAIRVPLLVWGPGILPGRAVPELSLNNDIAPTIADLVGVTPPAFVDGRSLVSLLSEPQSTPTRSAFLVEHFAPVRRSAPQEPQPLEETSNDEEIVAATVPPFRALRTSEAVYVEYDSGERELYNVRADPFQLDNVAEEADPGVMEDLSARLAQLARCSGAACTMAEDASIEVFGSP
jgi:N-acetylglucosamine-6-sulfatase